MTEEKKVIGYVIIGNGSYENDDFDKPFFSSVEEAKKYVQNNDIYFDATFVHLVEILDKCSMRDSFNAVGGKKKILSINLSLLKSRKEIRESRDDLNQ
jgi:hypothetical protein